MLNSALNLLLVVSAFCCWSWHQNKTLHIYSEDCYLCQRIHAYTGWVYRATRRPDFSGLARKNHTLPGRPNLFFIIAQKSPKSGEKKNLIFVFFFFVFVFSFFLFFFFLTNFTQNLAGLKFCRNSSHVSNYKIQNYVFALALARKNIFGKLITLLIQKFSTAMHVCGHYALFSYCLLL